MTSSTEQTKPFSLPLIMAGIALIILISTIPLVIVQNSEFGGSDGAGSEVVEHIAPEYDSSWATNWWEPPGGETESMLFALQATAGGILIGYFFGYLRGRNETVSSKQSSVNSKQ